MTTPSVETQLALISQKLDVLIEQRTDHEARIRKLEQFKWVLFGAAIASGPIANAISHTL